MRAAPGAADYRVPTPIQAATITSGAITRARDDRARSGTQAARAERATADGEGTRDDRFRRWSRCG